MAEEDPLDSNLLKAYRNALRKAWQDGRISIDERAILEQFTGDLPIPEETLSLLEAREFFRYRWSEYETSSLKHQLKILEKAMKVDPENDFVWMKKGSIQFKSGDLPGAHLSLDHALELDPLSEDAWFWKGCVFVKEEEFEPAIDCFEKAVEQEPDHVLSWIMMTRVERKLGHHDKAKLCSKRAIECSPEIPAGYVELSRTLVGSGEMEDALEALEKALDLDPESQMANDLYRSIVQVEEEEEEPGEEEVEPEEEEEEEEEEPGEEEVEPEEEEEEEEEEPGEEEVEPEEEEEEEEKEEMIEVHEVDLRVQVKPVAKKVIKEPARDMGSYLDEDMFLDEEEPVEGELEEEEMVEDESEEEPVEEEMEEEEMVEDEGEEEREPEETEHEPPSSKPEKQSLLDEDMFSDEDEGLHERKVSVESRRTIRKPRERPEVQLPGDAFSREQEPMGPTDEEEEEEEEEEGSIGETEPDTEGPDEPEAEEEEAEIIYKVIKCPHCKGPVPITTMERPIVIICPTCGAKGRLVR